MPTNKPKPSINDLKPGSSPADAAALVGSGDFGVAETDTVNRAYVSANTKASDPGNAQPHSFEHTGVRHSGSGARDNGPGSGSGGDLDTDVIGLDGAGLATNIDKQAPRDASESDGSSDGPASGGHAKGEHQTLVGKVGGRHEQVNVVTPSDERTLNTGSDEASNTVDTDIDDSFRGEVSSAEASGRDQAGD